MVFKELFKMCFVAKSQSFRYSKMYNSFVGKKTLQRKWQQKINDVCYTYAYDTPIQYACFLQQSSGPKEHVIAASAGWDCYCNAWIQH